MRNFLRYLGISVIQILATNFAFQAYAIQESRQPADIDFEKIDAIEAMAIANEWKWSQKNVKSFVDGREVVFQFSNGKKVSIPLPKEKMLVAVAPYLQKTHR